MGQVRGQGEAGRKLKTSAAVSSLLLVLDRGALELGAGGEARSALERPALAWPHLALCRSALASARLSSPFSFSFSDLFLKFSWILKDPHNIKDIVEIRGSPAITGHWTLLTTLPRAFLHWIQCRLLRSPSYIDWSSIIRRCEVCQRLWEYVSLPTLALSFAPTLLGISSTRFYSMQSDAPRIDRQGPSAGFMLLMETESLCLL